MCGIVGQLSCSPVDQTEFMRMRDTLVHRGPDDAGLYFADAGRVALGHRRLAFLDLSDLGRQPMPNEDETLWLTFNGEIYNYVELRKRLEGLGHCFRSRTDSEVILHGYEQWGAGVLDQLKGMFAFGLYDAKRAELMLARDRFGIKPVYYYDDGTNFIFASEIKAILASSCVRRDLDQSSIWDYFTYRYVPSPKTMWKRISKLPPAHSLLRRANGTVETRSYWQPPLTEHVSPPTAEVVSTVDELLLESVRQHVRSDVPVASFLSGGYDSSALVYYLSRLKYPRRTFAIGFREWDRSEHRYARLVARQFDSRHTDRIISLGGLDLVEQLMHHYDDPIADISIIPTYLLCQAARRDVKTVLSGEGADEMFGGYAWHRRVHQSNEQMTRWERLSSRVAGKRGLAIRQYSEAMGMGRFGTQDLRQLLHPDLAPGEHHEADWWYRSLYRSDLSPLKAIQYMDLKGFMSELVLTKVDRASMAHSLEIRVPFLDHDLFEYCCRLSEDVYFRPEQTKFVLHELLKKHLPPEILRRRKQGFVGPDRYYMNIDFYARAIYDGSLLQDHVIRREYIDRLIAQRDHWRLWKIAVFEFWYRRWVFGGTEMRTDDATRPVCRAELKTTVRSPQLARRITSKSRPASKQAFVFAVCGPREHIETLNVALPYLHRFTDHDILVVTDLKRNEAGIHHDQIVDVKTPVRLGDRAASIYLKTGLHRWLPPGRTYCYLDSDVLAVDEHVNEVFDQARQVIAFAADHCRLDLFSPHAVTCDCCLRYAVRREESEANNFASEAKRHELMTALEAWRDLRNRTRQAPLKRRRVRLRRLLRQWRAIEQEAALTGRKKKPTFSQFFRFRGFRFDRARQEWFDWYGNSLLASFPHFFQRRGFVYDAGIWYDHERNPIFSNNGEHSMGTVRCNHLAEEIENSFQVRIQDRQWQQWNGGLFVFDDQAHTFLDYWHEASRQVFDNPRWETRDQGTLVAAAWKFGLQNAPTLPVEFNYLADYYMSDLFFDRECGFRRGQGRFVRPHFVHVYHEFGRRDWEVWQWLESIMPQETAGTIPTGCVNG